MIPEQDHRTKIEFIYYALRKKEDRRVGREDMLVYSADHKFGTGHVTVIPGISATCSTIYIISIYRNPRRLSSAHLEV